MERKSNIFDKIGSLIPGYKGYADREARRNTDKILRESIAFKLFEVEKELYKRIEAAIKQKNSELAKEIDEVRKSLNTFTSNVKYAPHGDSGFFSDSKIKEDELEAIYIMDMELADKINELFSTMSDIEIDTISDIVASGKMILNNRNQYISEFK